MQELSMNILDIAQNSVRAKAALVEIALVLDGTTGVQTLTIADDGCGMSPEMVRTVIDPFCTTRTTRKVGLGLPFLRMAAQQTGGDVHIESTVGTGTTVTATFGLGHIDLMPLGDMPGTISALVQGSPDIDFIFRYARDGRSFVFDTREVRQILGDEVALSEPAVSLFIRDYIAEHLAEADGPGTG